MKLGLLKPDNFEKVTKVIDEQHWNVSGMLFLIVGCLDTIFKRMNRAEKLEILRLLVARYERGDDN